MLIVRYETVGDEHYESEAGPTLGYNNIESGICLCANEDMLADWWADGCYRRLDVIDEQPTLGQ